MTRTAATAFKLAQGRVLGGAAAAVAILALALPPAAAQPTSRQLATAPCPASAPALANARCGFLIVPENRARPEGRTIRLAVAILPAASGKPLDDPVVVMSGGPGGAALPLAEDLVGLGINRDRDVIVMDQRGVGSSQPALSCPEVANFRKTSIGLPYDAASTGRLLVDAAATCRRRLEQEGVDVGAYNTTENAADFADLRVALGVASWNVLGVSYGTDVALVYMSRHPEGVRSVIIDSVVPPDVANLSWTWTSVKRGVDNLFAACEAEPVCSQRYPHLAQTFDDLVRKLEASPITVDTKVDGRDAKVALDGGALVNWLQQHTILPKEVPADIDALAHGDPKPVALFFGALQSNEPLSRGMHLSVICSEWAPYEPASRVLEEGRRAFPGYPESVLQQPPALPFMREVCDAWNVPKAPAAIRQAVVSAIPTLSIGGSFDAVTGTQWAEYAVRGFPNAAYINIPGVSHFVALDSACAQGVIGSFLANPQAPDTSCVKDLKPGPFSLVPTANAPGRPPGDDL